VIGPNDPSACSADPNNCIEASLDVQQITSTAQLDTTTFRSEDPSVQDIFLDWINGIARDSDPPKVSSISYGSLAPEDPQNDMLTFNSVACKLGLRGITIVVASGDDGVANFGARSDPTQCGFTPSFPATSPYVTAVGATQGVESGTQEQPCLANNDGGITTGGGASIYFSRPSYQYGFVQNYLNQLKARGTLPDTTLWNVNGRMYPDVAIAGHNYPIQVGGATYTGSGTSASAPVFAAMVSLINGQRVANGKSTVGFLNAHIYALANTTLGGSHTKYFHNVTSDDFNNCCAGDPNNGLVCCTDTNGDPQGFQMLYPFNAGVGLGSIKFAPFSSYFANL